MAFAGFNLGSGQTWCNNPHGMNFDISFMRWLNDESIGRKLAVGNVNHVLYRAPLSVITCHVRTEEKPLP